MKKLLALLLLLAAPAALATTLTGTIKDAGGNPISGSLWWELSQNANVNGGACGGPYAIGPNNPVVFALTNGQISGPGGGPYSVTGNDCITPTTTFYHLTAINTDNTFALRRNVSITGSSVDIGALPVYGGGGGGGGSLSITGGAGISVSPSPLTSTGTVSVATGGVTDAMLATSYLKANGTRPLTGNWSAGNYQINSQNSTAWYNVVAYGADPTGSADSTTAVQAAIVAAGQGSVVYFPAGQYKLVSTLTSTKGMIFRGDGQAGSGAGGTILLVNTTTDAFNITNATSASVTFQDLTMYPIAFGNATAGAFIHANGSALFPLYVKNCYFTHFYYGIRLSSAEFSVIRDNVFINGTAAGTAAGGAAVYIDSTVSPGLGDIIIDGNNFSGGGATYGILQGYGAATRISANEFGGTHLYPVYLGTPAGQSQGVEVDFYVTNNKFENGTNASVTLAPASPFSNIVITENHFSDNAGGLNVSPTAAGNATGGVVVGNYFVGPGSGSAITFNPAAAAGANLWNISSNTFNYSQYCITLPGTVNYVQNLMVGPNQHVGETAYINGAFDSTSGFKPGIETVFSQTANSTTTANSLTTMLGTGIGSLTIPARRLMVGTVGRLTIRGYCSTADGGTATKTITFSVGGVTITTATTITWQTTLNEAFTVIATFTVRSTGGSGTAIGNINLMTKTGGGAQWYAANATATINTTTANVVDYKYNNGNATGVMTTTEATLEILN